MKYLATIFFFILSLNCFSQQKYFFDAINGNDNNTAAQAHNSATAWKTLTKLNSFFTSFAAGDSILLRRGQTFEGFINVTKNGTNVASINFGAWGTGNRPIVTGTLAASGFTNLGGNIWESGIITGALTTGICQTVTINGTRIEMGRFPNNNQDAASWRTYNAPSNTGTVATINDASGSPGSFIGAEVVLKIGDFEMNRGTITGQSGTQITFTPQSTHNGAANFGYFIQNAASTLDKLNEWFYNTSTQKVRIFSPTSPTGVRVANTTTLVQFTANGRQFITFNNITFNGCNGRLIDGASGMVNIKFTNCDLLNAGTDCIWGSGSNGFQLIGCTVSGTNNNIFIGSGSATGTYQDDTCTNNGILPGGAFCTNNAEFMGFRTFGNTNTWLRVYIDGIGFHGINFQGNNTIVRNCYVNNFSQILSDCGGIYTWRGNADATTYTNRVIDGCISNNASILSQYGTSSASNSILLAAAIYLDDFTQNVSITNCTGANSPRGLYLHNAFTGLTIRNNTFYNPTYGLIYYRNDAHAINGINSHQNIGVSRVATTEVFRYRSTSNDLNAIGVSDSNFFCRPIAETQVMQTEFPASTIYTLANFKATFNAIEQHSKGSPQTITNLANLQFLENHTTVSSTRSLSGTWIDMRGVSYNGSITLLPFTSAVLIFTGAATPLNATVTAALNPVACFGNVTSATVNATGGTAPYQYEIGSAGFGSSNVFTGLGAGTYVFTVRDAALATTTVNLTIVQPSQISISQSSPAITVNGNTTTTTVTASGGTGTLNYKLDAGSFQASNVFTGVGAGTHTITVHDANNCTNTLTYTLTQPSVLVISAAATTNPLLCFGNMTNATITASGGTTPYQYKLGNGSFQSSNIFTGLNANTYVFTVQDAGGAIKTTTLTITQPAQIIISESHTNIVINGGNSTVTITAANGANPKTYSLDGGSFQSSNVFAGVLAGTHTVIVRDANACQNSLAFTITQPTTLTLVATLTTAIACNGGTATATASASGGTTPYQYQVDVGTLQSSGIFSGLSAATHTFTVHDGGGGVVSTQLTITQPSQISIATTFGSAPTTVTVTASGGSGGLTYSLDGGSFQAGNTFANVAAGNHTVIVKDSNGCTNSQSFSVGSSLTISLSVGTISCNGGTTSATVIPAGGTFPYTFSWSNGQQTSTATALIAGTYTVTVHDNAAHVHDTTFTITQPTAIGIAIVTGTISVNGGTTTATVTASGGAGSYQYKLDGGSYQGSNSFSGIAAGNHTITVKDGNNCTQTQNFTLSQPGQLIISISLGAAIACNGSTQAVTVGATGGTTPYSGTGVQNKLAGTYTFTVTDAFGSVADTIVTITQPTALILSVTTGTIVVNGGTTTVTASGSGGTGSLQYKLDGGSFGGSGSFTGVSAGIHSVTVKDANNCTTVNNFSISQPDNLTMTATPGVNPFTCYGNTTTVTVVGTGGTTPFTYGKNGTFGGSGSFTNLSAGTYTFSVRDAFGAQHDTIVTLAQPPLITMLQYTQTVITSFGGIADVTVLNQGGTPVQDTLYRYQIDGGGYTLSDSAFSFIFTGVTGGNHQIDVKDANNCVQSFHIFIVQPQAPLQFWIRYPYSPRRTILVQL